MIVKSKLTYLLTRTYGKTEWSISLCLTISTPYAGEQDDPMNASVHRGILLHRVARLALVLHAFRQAPISIQGLCLEGGLICVVLHCL